MARIGTHHATEVTIRAVPMVNKIKDELKAHKARCRSDNDDGEGVELFAEEIWN